MRLPKQVSVFDKGGKRNLELLLTLSVFACALFLQGCSAVPSSTAAAQTPTQTRSITLPGASVGSSYYEKLVSNAPFGSVHLTQGQLPPGLTLNSADASIAGVPTTAGTFTFTVSTIMGPGARICTYSVAINAPNPVVTVQISPASTSFEAGTKVQFYAAIKGTSNTAVNWTASAGNISSSGLWTAPGSTSNNKIIITAISAADPSVRSSAIATIADAQFKINTSSTPPGVIHVPYSAYLAASGGRTPYEWSVLSGSLPAGLKLSGTGTLSGSPTTAGTYYFKVEGRDATGQTSQHSYTILVAKEAGLCGPPKYGCSRRDQSVVQVSNPPNVGNLIGANTVITDPDFGNRIVRITDANEDPYVPYANRSFMTATSGSADENIWNLDSTLLIVQDTGARGYPLSFNPSTMQASRMYVSSFPKTNGFTLPSSGTWSRVNPNLLYVETETAIEKYDFTDRVNNAPAPEPLYDFARSPNCLPAGFTATWRSRGGVSADDTVFAMGYSNTGGQGTGAYAVVYKVGSGCSVLNTTTGQVWGAWGVKGTITRPERWTIHNTKLSKDGNWLIIAKEECLITTCSKGPYFWQIGTTNVISCGDGGFGSGHWTEGFTHWVNNHNTPVGNEVIRLIAVSSSVRSLTPYLPGSGMIGILDQHPSWNNVDPADSVPFASSTWIPLSPFTGPWYNEVIGVATDGSGTIWRFAHNFITARNQNFTTEYGIGSISQDGRFFAFSSDWMGSLGSESGAKTCAIGSDCRGDVFVVELR